MNEAIAGRLALAQQLAPNYCANPKVAVVAVEGSVARRDADLFSDIDLAVFWSLAPTEKERRAIIKHAGGRHVQFLPSYEGEAYWSDTYEVGGVAIDVRHVLVEATERILAEVLKDCDSSLSKQQHLAALLSALPLYDPSSLLTNWQSRATVYPRELSMAMVRANLCFPPAWELEMLAERGELLALYESFCAVEKQTLLVLMGLNRLYYPGWQRVDRLMERMRIAPLTLAARFKQIFGIVSIDPLASVYQLHDLVEETFSLVQTHLSELDTTRARARFQERRQVWERIPDGLPEEA
ncbi:MAG TPA: nucleotidyltransferase domain-containing protein [Ktedonobacteraceae bacterium]